MKFIVWILVIIILLTSGYMVLNYFGYYIEWKIPATALVIVLPIIQAVRNFLQRPEKIFDKSKDN